MMTRLFKLIILVFLSSFVHATIKQFEYTCELKEPERDATFPSITNLDSINLKVTHRVTHQLVTRIFAIFLKKIIQFNNRIEIETIDENFRLIDENNEKTIEYHSIYGLFESDQEGKASINLEVWRTADHQQMFPTNVIEGNSLTENDIARFGLYIPKDLKPNTKFSYNNFIASDATYKRTQMLFRYNEADLDGFTREKINSEINNVKDGIYTPYQCISSTETCATVLTSNYSDTKFFIKHIEILKLKMKVYFLGHNLKDAVRRLSRGPINRTIGQKKLFLVLSWTPSDIIDGSDQFDEVIMPKCELYKTPDTSCKYEANSIAIFYNHKIVDNNELTNIIQNVKFNELKSLIAEYDRNFDKIKNKFHNMPPELISEDEKENDIENYYNEIACRWLNNHTEVYEMSSNQKWYDLNPQIVISLGGIYPRMNSGPEYDGIKTAIDMAEENFNDYSVTSQLSTYRLNIMYTQSECKPDHVLKRFISLFSNRKYLLGVLGPACSEAIEPLAAISKHYQLSVITYSAEGISFEDRDNYPYFYRTIGENKQYEDVFAKLFEHYSWKRIYAITEDGQKYTEYISRMEQSNSNSFKIMLNKKFPREKTRKEQIEKFEKLLKDLRDTHRARIIICDVHDHDLMKLLLCSAHKLKMTAKEGYIWWLPVYVSLKINEMLSIKNDTIDDMCTVSEYREALNGHFSLSYKTFGNDDDILPTNQSVRAWKNNYQLRRNISSLSPSDYSPYVYDAIWVYGKALIEIIREDSINGSGHGKYWYMNNLDSDETMKKLIEIIDRTSFQGVSGKIEFNRAGSRYTNVSVLQWQTNDFKLVGTYTPIIVDKRSIDGNLKINESAIHWHSKDPPDDGHESCLLKFLADALHTECHTINSILIVILCILIILACSGLSFLFWKHKYAKKLEESAKIMMNYGRVVNGIELSKWEVPRENVIINRRIGEGCFGTVYGGEVLINEEEGFKPAAIKTLKAGSTPENRLDFLAESEIMKRFEHKNIIKLLAVCLQKEPLYSVMEFMLYGDLKTYLLSRRHLVADKINEDTNDISPKRLTLMALDVARGLSYLASLSFVHRDIACRNCLINAQRIVKIGDFGMARSTCENDYYRFTRKGMLPIRWMAPESIDGGVFSHASDVWSFGVLLYEVVTLGGFPFQGLNNNQVFELVKSGESIKIPQQTKPPLKALMSSCFNIDQKKRPGASTIVEFISNYPRMLSPCMNDIPKPNLDEQVNLLDSDINEDFEFEQLMENRERSHTPAITVDFLRTSASSSALQNQSHGLEFDYLDMKLPRRVNGGIYNLDLTSTLPNANYNPIEPLLNNRSEISKSTLSLMKYVPMCGFNKNRNRSSPEECTSAL